MKKTYTILLLLLVIVPTVFCLCPTAFVGATCAMDEPSSCCCETEVRDAASPQFLEYVAPTDLQVPELVVADAAVSHVDRCSTDDARFARTNTSVSLDGAPIYLTHQSFLI